MSISADGSVNGKNEGRKRTSRSSFSKKRRRKSVYTPFRSAKLMLSSIQDRKSTRLNSSHLVISYAVFCLKKKSLQLPVLAPDRADAHALEALGDRVAEEPHRLKALREEVAVDHRPAAIAVVLVHDLEQPLLERADAVGLRPRVTFLAIVRGLLDAPVLYRPGEACRADAQARRRPDALVHRRAARLRPRGLREGRVGLERQGRDERRVVEQAVLRIQDDVRRERARAEPGQLGGVHHRHRRLVAVDG